MNLKDWEVNGWIKPHKTSRKEITNLISSIDNDLSNCRQEFLSENWRFKIAYSAVRKCCYIPLYCMGYSIVRGGSEHHRVIQSLPLTLGRMYNDIRDYLDSCRSKRNINEYGGYSTFSKKEVDTLIKTTESLLQDILSWLGKRYPEYL